MQCVFLILSIPYSRNFVILPAGLGWGGGVGGGGSGGSMGHAVGLILL